MYSIYRPHMAMRTRQFCCQAMLAQCVRVRWDDDADADAEMRRRLLFAYGK